MPPEQQTNTPINPTAPSQISIPQPNQITQPVVTTGVFTPQPMLSTANNQSKNSQDLQFGSTKKRGFTHIISFAAGIASLVLAIVVIINVFSFDSISSLKSVVLLIALIVVLLLALTGILFGYLNQKNNEQRNALSIVGLAISASMFVTFSLVGSYYIKATLLLNSYNKQFEASQKSSITSQSNNSSATNSLLKSSTDSGQQASSKTSAADTERMTDIKAIYSQVEAFYGNTGRYPTLANLNDAKWRAANMSGILEQQLKDPKGTSATLLKSPAPNAYSYVVTASDGTECNNSTKDCTQYTLTTTLDNGEKYTKINLN